jgi:hypothetical protein
MTVDEHLKAHPLFTGRHRYGEAIWFPKEAILEGSGKNGEAIVDFGYSDDDRKHV